MVTKNDAYRMGWGSWKCGKANSFSTYPQAIPNAITLKRVGGGANALYHQIYPHLKCFVSKLLTIPIIPKGGEM